MNRFFPLAVSVLGLTVVGCREKAIPKAPAAVNNSAVAPATGVEVKGNAGNPQQLPEKKDGSLRISLTRETHLVSDYWIYVDGRIVQSDVAPKYSWIPQGTQWSVYSDDRSTQHLVAVKKDGQMACPKIDALPVNFKVVSLAPGEHKVEVMVANHFLLREGELGPRWIVSESFPLTLKSAKTVTVEPGKLSVLNLDVSAEVREVRYGKQDLSKLYEESPALVAPVKRLELVIDVEMKRYRSSPIVKAMHEALRSISQPEQPLRPAIVIDLPQHYSGKREFDAKQVQLLIDWMKVAYLDLSLIHYDAASTQPLLPGEVAQRERFEKVRDTIHQQIRDHYQLNGMIKNLQSPKK